MAYYSDEKIAEMFTHHPPEHQKQIDQHEGVRSTCLDAALRINGVVPDCAEKTFAIRALQQASMWANAALALNRKGSDGT